MSPFKKISYGYLLIFILISCADIEPENTGYATISIQMNDDSHQRNARSALAQDPMTVNDAKTILAVLVPDLKCEVDSANSGVEYNRALVDTSNHQLQLLVPLNSRLKFCLYFFRDELNLAELGIGNSTPDGYGESGIFTVNSETKAKNIIVEFWTTAFADITMSISSSSSAGFPNGAFGTVKLNSSAGKQIDNKSFTTSDNASNTIQFTNITYNTYSYDVELQGFVPAREAFLVEKPLETLDIQLTPNMVELDWISFDNLTITQQGSNSKATASGNLILTVPIAQKDNIIQMVSTMQVKRVGESTTVDVTPPVQLSSADWNKTIGSDNVTYQTSFATGSAISLVNGSNELQVIITLSGLSKTQSMGSVNYDACLDSWTMCAKLTWDNGTDPDLHSYYFPEWTYQEEQSGFDNASRGTRYWIYSNASNKSYSETGDVIQLKDGISPSDEEVQVWATSNGKVGNGTYLFYVEDVSNIDVFNFQLVLSGPGLSTLGYPSDNTTYGPYNFKNDFNAATTEALNPQAVFFIQVQNNTIMRLDAINVGSSLGSNLLQWTGPMQNSAF